MILRALELQHFRRHVERVRVAFHDRFSVVHGANEAGKSTLFTALEYAFFRRVNANAADIERIVPWSASGIHPTLAVEFGHDGAEYRLEKTFRGVGGSSLVKRRSAAGTYEAWLGDGADEYAAALFDGEFGTVTKSGFRPSHRGIAHFLFAPQGRMAIRGDDRDLALGPDADARLNRLVGAAAQSPDEARLVAAIEKAYAKTYVKSGALAKAAASTELGKALEAAEVEVSRLEQSLTAYGELALAADLARSNAREIGDRHRVAAVEADAAQPRLVAALDARRRTIGADAGVRETRAAYDLAVERDRALSEAAETLAALEPRRLDAVAGSAAAELASRATLAERERRRSAANAANAQDAELADLERRHADAVRRSERRAELAALEERRGRITRLSERQSTLAREREAVAAPTAAELETLRELAAKRTASLLTLELGRARVSIAPETATSIGLAHAGGDEVVALLPGSTLDYSVDGTFALTLAGFGTITIVAPVRDEAKEKRDLLALERRIAATAGMYGTSDVAALASLVARAGDLDVRLAAARAELAFALGDDDRAALDARAAALERLLDVPAEDAASLATAIARRERAVAERRARAGAAATEADVAYDRAVAAGRDAERALASLDRRAEPARAVLAGGAHESPAQRATVKRETYAALDAATIERDAAHAAYEPFRDLPDPAAAADRERRRSDDLARMLSDAKQQAVLADERVRVLASEGLSHVLAEALERRAALRRDYEAARATELAVKLLRDLTLELETDRARSFAQPVLDFVGPHFTRLTGRTIVSLDIGSTHGMNGVSLADARRAVDWLELSGGAADQLALLIRLGYAHLLSAPEHLGRIPVLLDDPLVNSDDTRRRAMLEIFDEVSERIQLVAFTCRQTDYAGSRAAYGTIEPHP